MNADTTTQFEIGQPVTVTPTRQRYGGLPYIENRGRGQQFGTGPTLPAYVTSVHEASDSISVAYGPGQCHYAGLHADELTPRDEVDPAEHLAMLEQLALDHEKRGTWATIAQPRRDELATIGRALRAQVEAMREQVV